ncbi:ATP-binding cassette domain-containing protein, partial [bacterium]|nr:ATP-binding cassette domain-containing protein [bacterium]
MTYVANFTNVTKRYPRGILALSRVTLQLTKGEFTFLTGPSGAGKTTFLRLLFGEEHPTDGELAVLGYDMNHLKSRQLPRLRRRIGVVFQDFRLLSQRTTVENLDIALRICRLSKEERIRRIKAILRIVELEGRADSFAEELSGGEQQRVA